jgi:REP element-mobilizing transposase RayT
MSELLLFLSGYKPAGKMTKFKTYYKRNMPHYQPPGYVFFVTTRLAGSLPVSVVLKMKKEYENKIMKAASLKSTKIKRNYYEQVRENYFTNFEEELHRYQLSPKWLGEEIIASIVRDSLHFSDGKDYDLFCYTIMSNHIHIILKPIVTRNSVSRNDELTNGTSHNNTFRIVDSDYILTKILQNFKKFTARECNIILGRKGQFWHHESYDHVVRDKEELIRITEYILNNPVKAKLVDDRDKWKWNYYNPELYL